MISTSVRGFLWLCVHKAVFKMRLGHLLPRLRGELFQSGAVKLTAAVERSQERGDKWLGVLLRDAGYHSSSRQVTSCGHALALMLHNERLLLFWAQAFEPELKINCPGSVVAPPHAFYLMGNIPECTNINFSMLAPECRNVAGWFVCLVSLNSFSRVGLFLHPFLYSTSA